MKPQFDPSNISNRSEDELECLLKILYPPEQYLARKKDIAHKKKKKELEGLLKILYTPEQYRTYEEDIARSMIE